MRMNKMEQVGNRTDMLTIADTVARAKGIDKDQVLEALESAIQKAAVSRYGLEFDIRATINRITGAIELARYTEIVESDDEVENEMTQVPLDVAKISHPDLEVGAFIIEELPPLEFGRIAAQTAKQVIVQKVRDAERDRQFEDYKDRIGEIVIGTVKRSEYNTVTVDLGMSEAVLRRDDLIGREQFRRGDRVRAYISDVRREQRGPQIFLSRTHPQFLVALFKLEVPELEDGTIQITKVSRDPGSRAKICVKAEGHDIDPVGSCVGMRGNRVQAVVTELLGEKIDIIQDSDSEQALIKKALQPAEVSRVIIDEITGKVEVVVPEDQLSLAIGRRGQNVRLASQLVGRDLDILTETQEQERRETQYAERSKVFKEIFGLDDVMSRLLVTEGFTSVEDLAEIALEELEEVGGLTATLASELHTKAKEHLANEEKAMTDAIKALKIQQDLLDFLGESPAVISLGKADVKSLEDLADLASDELSEILIDMGITEDEAANIIMQARETAGWFDDLPAVEGEDATEEEKEA